MALALRTGSSRPVAGSHSAGRAAARAAAVRRLLTHWPALLVLATALTTRLVRIDTAYEIHVDEVSYADTATVVAQGGGLTMFGIPFHLHPPGYFVLLAVWEELLDVVGITEPDRFAQVLHLRPVGALLGSLTCVVVTLLVARLAGRVPAVLAGLVLALDPFANRWDSRVFLEAPSTFFGAVAISCLVAVVRRDRPRGRLLVGAGLAVAACTLCKEPYAFLSVLPPLALFVTGRLARRRDTGTILGVAVACNVGLLGALAAAGELGDWWTEQGSGLMRLIGADQQTGYNAPGAQSASSSFADQLGSFAPSVALALLGALSCALVVLPALPRLWRTRRIDDERLAGRIVTSLWTGCAFAYVGYAFCFGTFEEQNVSMLLAPSATGLGVLLGLLLRRRTVLRVVAAVAVVAVLLGAGSATWLRVHTTRDDTYLQLHHWLDTSVPLDARIAMTEETGQFLYDDYDVSGATTLDELTDDQVDFVLLSTELVGRGYGTATPELLSTLQQRATLVFTATGQSLGHLEVWDVRAVTGGSGRVNSLDLPPVS
jgi:4-amino-4-deoxy-L-arabinose transferase-like glycosyltransferase